MSAPARSLLFWLPRVAATLFAAFLTVFALDAFDEGTGVIDTAMQLALHLVPSLIVLLALALAWRWEWLGGVAFLGMAVWYVATSWGRFPLSTYLVIAGPLALVAVLFFAGWAARTRTHA